MAACSNCGKALSCGCQRKTASNGRSVCNGCISSYEDTLRTEKNATRQQTNTSGNAVYSNLYKFIKR